MVLKGHGPVAAILTFLCLLAYAPSLTIPLIEDDYPNLYEAQRYGSIAGLPELVASPIARMRATSYWSMYPLYRRFLLWAPAYHLFSLVLHVLNTLLVYAIGLRWQRLRGAAVWAAGFFAIHEGHQEAVMWFSAINELWMFFFGAASLLCWLEARERQRTLWYVASVLLFAFAVVSKEAAVIFLPLFLLVSPRKPLWAVWPYTLIAAAAVAGIYFSRTNSFRFSDGSFSLHASFWITWPRGIFRLFWIWGIPAAIVLWYSRNRSALWVIEWMALGLVPYIFLTYSTAIPSRQTYLASAGLAWLVGLAMAQLWRQHRRWVAAIVAVVLLHNVGILWLRKRAQFLARAEPTERLIALARQTSGPIWIQCFPRPTYIAQEALHLGAGRDPNTMIWTAAEARERKPAAVFCTPDR